MATVTKPIALDESFNTTEVTPRNIADVLAEELSRITGRNASQVEYDNTESGLTADNVQEALDEIVEAIPTVPSVDIQTAVDEFSTYNGGILSSLKVSLTPNQDLHGYDSPWVGGAGKNKAQDPKTGVYSSITGEWSGGDVYAHSIAKVNPNTTYTMSVGNVGNVSVLLYYNNDPSSTPQNYFISAESVGAVSTYTFTTPPTAQYVIYETGSSATPRTKDNVGFIQIELGSTATAYEPYENICPISGHTQAKVGDDGKNKADPNTLEVGYYSTTGYNSSANFKTTAPISVEVGKTYFGKVFNTNDLTEKYDVVYATFSSDDTTNALRQIVGGSITIQSGEKYVRVRNNSDQTPLIQSGNFVYQLELGSTATPYVPYNGYQITVNLGGTYYSGTLDVVTGVFTPDMASDDLGSLTDTYYDSTKKRFISSLSGVKTTSASDMTTAISSAYEAVSFASLYNDLNLDGVFAISTQGSLSVRNLAYTDVNAFKTAMSGQTIVYPLANPTPIQLSPTMVKALVGENHLSAPLEGQEITESKYRQLFTWDEVEAYVNAHSGGGSGMNYSTEEQVIGTWIDNKPLYQITTVFPSEITVNNNTWTDTTIPTTDKKAIVNVIGMNSTGTCWNILSANCDNGSYVQVYHTRGTVIGLKTLTIQYTKTTD